MRRSRLLLVPLCCIFLYCGDPGDRFSEPAPPSGIPYPDLGEILQEEIRGTLEERRREFDSAIERIDEPDRRAAAFGELGMLYHAHDQWDEAIAAYGAAGLAAPAEPRWPYYRGLVLEHTGEIDAAETAFEAALELRADLAPALLRVAELRVAAGELDDAQVRFETVIERQPLDGYAHYGLGRIALLRDDPSTALLHFQKAMVAQPGADSLHMEIARTLRALGRDEQAARHADQAGDRLPEIQDPLLLDVIARGSSAQAHLLRGNQALVTQRYRQAIDEYRRALAVDPDNLDVHLALGSALFLDGDVPGSRGIYQAAVDLFPGAAPARLGLGELLAATGRHREALAQFDAVLAGEPEQLTALIASARSLHEAGRHAESVERYLRAEALQPDEPRVRVELPVALAADGQTEEAARRLRKLVAEQPQNAEARLLWGTILASRGDAVGALEQLEAATQLEADNAVLAEAQLNIGLIRGGAGDPAGAAEALRAALADDPTLDVARLQLAGLLSREGRHEEAMPHYRELARTMPGEPSVHLGLSLALLLDGSAQAAIQALAQGLQARPRDPALASALSRLLATAADPALRDAPRAFELARLAVEAAGTPAHNETLAMALAANGEFARAAQIMDQLANYASNRGNAAFARRLQEMGAEFRAGRAPTDPFGSRSR
jgi:tetratricopeptide (TPR) repeat protein